MSNISINFLSRKMLYRCQHATLRNEQLARAIGFKPKDHPTIIDATAGLGRDSFILAALGFTVTMLERSPMIYAALAEGLEKASNDTYAASVCKRLHLIHADAITWLSEQTYPLQVIYLDPMFPARKKSASVKKEMVSLQELLGNDKDLDTLFEKALTCASHRVVIKRPRLAPLMRDKKPSYSLVGKSSRFDIYINVKTKK